MFDNGGGYAPSSLHRENSLTVASLMPAVNADVYLQSAVALYTARTRPRMERMLHWLLASANRCQ